MDTSSLPGGMYVVRLYQGELAVASERLVVSKE
jgi:hypothetical protein